MKEIKLTKGMVALVDDEDYEWLNQFKWYAGKGWNTYYASRNAKLNGKRILLNMHVAIMGTSTGLVDHIDGDGLNNQRYNLRRCTRAQNGMNRSPNKNSTSKYKGVYKAKGKYVAAIAVNGTQAYLGTFTLDSDAAKAYDKAAKEHFGEFAYLNFP